MDTLFQDLRYALRMLVKSPAFTAVAVLTLALGIGANTAIFSIVNALLLKMLPVKAPHELVVLGDPALVHYRWSGTPSTGVFSYPLYRELRDNCTVFQGLIAAGGDDGVQVDADSLGGASHKTIYVRLVSGNYFPLLGIGAAAGRALTESDDGQEGANPVVVLSYGYWKRNFALSPEVIGKSIRLNGYAFTIVGVAEENFQGDVVGDDPDVYAPLSMETQIIRETSVLKDAKVSWLNIIGRVKPGVSKAQADANVNFVFQQSLKSSYGAQIPAADFQNFAKQHIEVSAGGAGFSEFRNQYRAPLLLLMGIVGLVLLIASVNVANLLLARATARSKEIAVRLAIGATRMRLLRQWLTESILLAFVGGICGALLAIGGVRLLVTMFGSDAKALPLAPDVRVLLFTAAVCLLTGVLFGIAPALRTGKVEVNPTLKQGSSQGSEARAGFSWGKGLIAGQVALSLLVLFSASLLVRSLQKVVTQDFGYDASRIVVVHPSASAAGYKGDRMKQLAETLATRLSALPGVRGATYSRNGLFSGGESSYAIVVPGFDAPRRERSAKSDDVGPGYFDLLGEPILMGRGIGPQDTATSTRVAVVNEAMMNHFFHGENPIGRQFEIDNPDEKGKPFTVVGVSKDAKDHGDFLRTATPPRFYFAFQQDPHPPRFVLEVVTSGDPNSVLASVRSQIKAVDAHLPINTIETVRARLDDILSSQISLAQLSAFFAGLALLLACIGLYGIMAYTVAGRTREFGVRIALGARRGDVLRLVLREGMLLVGVGLLAGVPLALAASRLLQSFLFGLKNTDLTSMLVGIVLLGVVACIAAFVPARRATRVDPIMALRYE